MSLPLFLELRPSNNLIRRSVANYSCNVALYFPYLNAFFVLSICLKDNSMAIGMSLTHSPTHTRVSCLRSHSRAPVSTDSVSAVCRDPKKDWKLKKETVHKFQNARQARMDRNMVKSSSANAPSASLIFLCSRTHASPQNLPPFCF
jgi:hypothetical protein